MRELLRRNPLAVLLAVLMHGLLLAFMVVGVDWLKPPKPKQQQVEIVQARVLDQSKLAAQVEKLKAAEREKQAQSDAARRKEEQRLAELKRQREQEKKRLAELERQRKAREQAEAKRRAEAEKKAEQEKQRLADLKRKQEQEAKELAALEAKRRQEQEKQAALEAERKAAEAKRVAEEKRRKEEAARQKAEQERKAAAEAAARAKAEKAAREAELARQFEAEQDDLERGNVIAAIRQKVTRNWLRPPGTAEQGLKCTVRVRLGGSGSVLLVNVTESSGNGAFDRSVEAAVRKADPLPMPSSPRLLSQFKEILFVFDPAEGR